MNPISRSPTPEERETQAYRAHKESLKQYDPDYVPWNFYWLEAFDKVHAEMGYNPDLLRARLRVIRSQDARELCEFFDLVKARLLDRSEIHEITGYDA
jgi:hypothetical protein